MALKPKNVDFEKISISSKPKKLDFGGSMVYINYDSGIQPLYVQTPELHVPFDMSYFSDNETSGKYNVKINFKDIDNNKKVKEFYDFIHKLDNFIKDKAFENTVSWFKGKKSKEVIDSLYTPMIKVHVDPETGEASGKYPDQFGFKIIKKNDKVLCSIYDKEKNVFDVNKETDNPMDIERIISKGSNVMLVLKCNGVWIANGKFGCTWRAEQIRVEVSDESLDDFSIVSDSEDEDNSNDDNVNKVDLVEDSESDTDNSSDSDSSDENKEVVPEPPKETKKKARKVKVKSNN